MRAFRIILLLLAFAGGSYAQDVCVFAGSNHQGVPEEGYFVPLGMMSGGAGWQPGSDKAVPFTKDQALELVKTELIKRGVQEIREDQFRIVLREISERMVRDQKLENSCRWFYEFDYSQGVREVHKVIVTVGGVMAEFKRL